jgi:integrase
MALMATIKQRPGGTWEYRRRVPDKLRPLLKLTEVRRSLDTKDRAEAKLRVVAVIAEVDRLFAAAGQVITLDHRQVVALAAEWLSSRVTKGEASPPDALTIDVQISAIQDAHEDRRAILRLMSSAVDDLLMSKSLPHVDQPSREDLSIALFWSDLTYWQTMSRRRAGDYGPVPGVAGAPAFVPPAVTSKDAPGESPTSFASIWSLWVKSDEDRAPKTLYEGGKKWDILVRYMHDTHGITDAAKVTKEHARAWVDSLKASDIAPRTINFGYIAFARAAYNVACKRDVLQGNPFAGLAVKINKVALARDRRQGFTDEEARRYLQAARARGGWVRWVVSVMAYSGCRLEEVTDARACDVREEKGIPVLDINLDGEGRRLKNAGSARLVPLHPSISTDLLKYARGLRDQSGPLFPDLDPDRFGERSGTASKVLGRMLRDELKITDPRKVGAHSWRHRLKTLGREHDIPEAVLDQLCGHAPRSEGERYGAHLLPKIAAHVARLPYQG